MGRKNTLEAYDQYIFLGVLFFIVLYLAIKIPTAMLLLAGAIVFFGAMLLFNKGKKETVNLGSDITYIAIGIVVLLSVIYGILTLQDLALIAIAGLLIAFLIQLYR